MASAVYLIAALLFVAVPGPAAAKYASIVLEAESGVVLHATNANTRNYPASLTKMMTLYMLFEALENGELTENHTFKVSRRAAGQAPSKLGLRKGQRITVHDAILALVTKSANDVATVVAEGLGGTEANFAKMMTARAQRLGMTRTTFRNASGLPHRGQLSTARDLAMLSRALIYDFPRRYRLFATKAFKYRGRTYRNHNKLLSTYAGTDGVKTGYTRASGFNLAASAQRNGVRLIAVVMGGKTGRSRDSHMRSLLDKGFARSATLIAAAPKAPGVPKAKPELKPPAPIVAAPAVKKRDDRPATMVAAAQPVVQPVAVVQPAAAAQPATIRQNVAIAQPQAAVTAPTVKAVVAALPQPVGKQAGPDPDGPWGIQVGAFTKFAAARQTAERAARALPKMLNQTIIAITSAPLDGTVIYRARLVGVPEIIARRACGNLQNMNMACHVVAPSGQIAALAQ